ncbi:MAG: DUF4437 domain-containing protein [Flavobacteriales bacterium]|nr:DUF4437 domain-containing protein [Flavobacteriales bacterium]
MKYTTLLLLTSSLLVFGCADTTTDSATNTDAAVEPSSAPTNKVLLLSEVDWQQLNPARGDASPLAGTLWGDRNREVPTGFLARFQKGFSSPPHIHNITYRAVVIEGLIHNDDPAAADMWMPPGSFWTQPAGESHITSANGESNMALVEIDHGPYLVQPIEQASDNGERPINIDASNVVWVNPAEGNNKGVKVAYLWDDAKTTGDRGLFIELPSGFSGELMSDGETFRGVVIQGSPEYTIPGESESQTLEPGSYFSSTAESVHPINTSSESVIYVRTNGEVNAL